MPENDDDIRKREDTTIEEARERGIGQAEDGAQADIPAVTDHRGVSDLGVEEPIVPRPLRGRPPAEDGDPEP